MSPRRNWNSPNPSLACERAHCPSPRNQRGRGGGHTRLRVRGLGSPNFDDWRKSLAICLLCGPYMACKPKNTTTTLHENHYHWEDVALVQSRPALARPLAPPLIRNMLEYGQFSGFPIVVGGTLIIICVDIQFIHIETSISFISSINMFRPGAHWYTKNIFLCTLEKNEV